jgi:hypothetical protein
VSACVRISFFPSLVTCLLLSLSAGTGACQEGGISRKHDPWGRFEPGAWKLVRVVTETLDEKGLVVSTSSTETTTILTAVGKEGVTLEVQTTVEVAGKRFDAEPQAVKLGFHGEILTKDLKVQTPVEGSVSLDGRKIPCRVYALENAGPTSKTVTKVHYSDAVAPYVLRREAITTDLSGESTLSETTAEVEARDMPWKVLNHRQPATIIKSTQKHAKGTIITWAVASADVPGGIVTHTSKEVDKNGRVIRRSTLDLVSFGMQCEEDDRPGTPGRRRRPRLRDSSAYYQLP